MTLHYNNTPTVVVVLVPLLGGLLMIRRALPGEGQGNSHSLVGTRCCPEPPLVDYVCTCGDTAEPPKTALAVS
jgi:hypothetical protein